MQHSNVVQLFPNRSTETIHGVRVTFIRQEDGTVSWEFTKPVGALRMTGSGDDMDTARARAASVLAQFPGSRDARSPTK
jgi:hypothetical protein